MDYLSVAEKVVKIALAVGKIAVTGGLDFATAKTAIELAKTGRSLWDDLTEDQREFAKRLEKAVETRMAALEESADHSPDELHDARVHLEQALTYASPDPDFVVEAGLDADRMGRVMLEAAIAAGPSHEFARYYATESFSRRFFLDIVKSALQPLFDDPAFVERIAPALWRRQLEQVSAIDDKVTYLYQQEKARAAFEGLPLAVAQRIAHAFGAGVGELLDVGRLGDFLEAKAAEFQKLQTNLAARSPADDPEVGRLRAEAAELMLEDDFESADALLSEAERRDEESEVALLARRQSRAESRAKRGDLSKLRLAYREASEHYRAAAEISPDPGWCWRFALLSAESLVTEGHEFGVNSALEEAVMRYRNDVLPLARDAERSRAALFSSFEARKQGDSLTAEEALDAMADLMNRLAMDPGSLAWAHTHNSLGIALAILGEREAGITHLEEAAAAFQTALKERTRENAEGPWAETSINLANVLQTIAEREQGTVRLEEAVTSYRAALEVLDSTSEPKRWAAAQLNLGNARMRLGERTDGSDQFRQALDAYEQVLTATSREGDPLLWGRVKFGQANALRSLGLKEGDVGLIEQSLEANAAAQEELTRARLPLLWAAVLVNFGDTLMALAEREDGSGRLEQALSAVEDALTELSRERVAIQWAQALSSKARALALLGERQDRSDRLELAVAAGQAALEVLEEKAEGFAGPARAAVRRAQALLAERRDASGE